MPFEGENVRGKKILTGIGVVFFLLTSIFSATRIINNLGYTFDLRSLAMIPSEEAGGSGSSGSKDKDTDKESSSDRIKEREIVKNLKNKITPPTTNTEPKEKDKETTPTTPTTPLVTVGECPGMSGSGTQECFVSQNRETGELIYNWITNPETGQTTSMTGDEIAETYEIDLEDLQFTPITKENNSAYVPVSPFDVNPENNSLSSLMFKDAYDKCIAGGGLDSICREDANATVFNFEYGLNTSLLYKEAYDRCLAGGGLDSICREDASAAVLYLEVVASQNLLEMPIPKDLGLISSIEDCTGAGYASYNCIEWISKQQKALSDNGLYSLLNPYEKPANTEEAVEQALENLEEIKEEQYYNEHLGAARSINRNNSDMYWDNISSIGIDYSSLGTEGMQAALLGGAVQVDGSSLPNPTSPSISYINQYPTIGSVTPNNPYAFYEYLDNLAYGTSGNILYQTLAGIYNVDYYAPGGQGENLLKYGNSMLTGAGISSSLFFGGLASPLIGQAITNLPFMITTAITTATATPGALDLFANLPLQLGLVAYAPGNNLGGYTELTQKLYADVMIAKGVSYGLSLGLQALASTGRLGSGLVSLVDIADNFDDTSGAIECALGNEEKCYETAINLTIGPKDLFELPVVVANLALKPLGYGISLTPQGTVSVNNAQINLYNQPTANTPLTTATTTITPDLPAQVAQVQIDAESILNQGETPDTGTSSLLADAVIPDTVIPTIPDYETNQVPTTSKDNDNGTNVSTSGNKSPPIPTEIIEGTPTIPYSALTLQKKPLEQAGQSNVYVGTQSNENVAYKDFHTNTNPSIIIEQFNNIVTLRNAVSQTNNDLLSHIIEPISLVTNDATGEVVGYTTRLINGRNLMEYITDPEESAVVPDESFLPLYEIAVIAEENNIPFYDMWPSNITVDDRNGRNLVILNPYVESTYLIIQDTTPTNNFSVFYYAATNKEFVPPASFTQSLGARLSSIMSNFGKPFDVLYNNLNNRINSLAKNTDGFQEGFSLPVSEMGDGFSAYGNGKGMATVYFVTTDLDKPLSSNIFSTYSDEWERAQANPAFYLEELANDTDSEKPEADWTTALLSLNYEVPTSPLNPFVTGTVSYDVALGRALNNLQPSYIITAKVPKSHLIDSALTVAEKLDNIDTFDIEGFGPSHINDVFIIGSLNPKSATAVQRVQATPKANTTRYRAEQFMLTKPILKHFTFLARFAISAQSIFIAFIAIPTISISFYLIALFTPITANISTNVIIPTLTNPAPYVQTYVQEVQVTQLPPTAIIETPIVYEEVTPEATEEIEETEINEPYLDVVLPSEIYYGNIANGDFQQKNDQSYLPYFAEAAEIINPGDMQFSLLAQATYQQERGYVVDQKTNAGLGGVNDDWVTIDDQLYPSSKGVVRSTLFRLDNTDDELNLRPDDNLIYEAAAWIGLDVSQDDGAYMAREAIFSSYHSPDIEIAARTQSFISTLILYQHHVKYGNWMAPIEYTSGHAQEFIDQFKSVAETDQEAVEIANNVLIDIYRINNGLDPVYYEYTDSNLGSFENTSEYGDNYIANYIKATATINGQRAPFILNAVQYLMKVEGDYRYGFLDRYNKLVYDSGLNTESGQVETSAVPEITILGDSIAENIRLGYKTTYFTKRGIKTTDFLAHIQDVINSGSLGDTIVIQLGTNDLSSLNVANEDDIYEIFIPSYERIINELREANPDVDILISPIPETTQSWNNLVQPANDALVEMSDRLNSDDNYPYSEIIVINGGDPLVTSRQVGDDGVHPANSGVNSMTEYIDNAIDEFLNQDQSSNPFESLGDVISDLFTNPLILTNATALSIIPVVSTVGKPIPIVKPKSLWVRIYEYIKNKVFHPKNPPDKSSVDKVLNSIFIELENFLGLENESELIGFLRGRTVDNGFKKPLENITLKEGTVVHDQEGNILSPSEVDKAINNLNENYNQPQSVLRSFTAGRLMAAGWHTVGSLDAKNMFSTNKTPTTIKNIMGNYKLRAITGSVFKASGYAPDEIQVIRMGSDEFLILSAPTLDLSPTEIQNLKDSVLSELKNISTFSLTNKKVVMEPVSAKFIDSVPGGALPSTLRSGRPLADRVAELEAFHPVAKKFVQNSVLDRLSASQKLAYIGYLEDLLYDPLLSTSFERYKGDGVLWGTYSIKIYRDMEDFAIVSNGYDSNGYILVEVDTAAGLKKINDQYGYPEGDKFIDFVFRGLMSQNHKLLLTGNIDMGNDTNINYDRRNGTDFFIAIPATKKNLANINTIADGFIESIHNYLGPDGIDTPIIAGSSAIYVSGEGDPLTNLSNAVDILDTRVFNNLIDSFYGRIDSGTEIAASSSDWSFIFEYFNPLDKRGIIRITNAGATDSEIAQLATLSDPNDTNLQNLLTLILERYLGN